MFDDLTLEELTALRAKLRTAIIDLVSGQQTAEIRYGDQGQKFHPANADAARTLLNDVNAAIDKLNGCAQGGGFIPVTG